MYILPSLFTTANMALGYLRHSRGHARARSPNWHLDNAAKAIGFAVLFDGLDGRIARMTGTSSDFGRELDSLADVITFGVAPACSPGCGDFIFIPPGLLRLDHNVHIKLTQFGAIASFLFSDGRSQPAGALQHHQESAALESGPSRKEIFCRHAHPRRRRRNRRRRPFPRAILRFVVDRDHLVLMVRWSAI